MWIITQNGVAINVDHVSKLWYRDGVTMAKVDGQTTIVANEDAIPKILDTATTINFREGE